LQVIPAFAALCYLNFTLILPVEGSAYAYAYGTIGEAFCTGLCGWGLILEYAMGSTVAVSSGIFNKNACKMFA
jgi:APA family basic amino acid/polyamine antiporter